MQKFSNTPGASEQRAPWGPQKRFFLQQKLKKHAALSAPVPGEASDAWVYKISSYLFSTTNCT